MKTENVARFYQKLAADGDLQKELQATTAAAAEQAVVTVAAKKGFAFSLDELRAHLAAQVQDLNEEDLAQVAGGVGQFGGLGGPFVARIGLMMGSGSTVFMGDGLAARSDIKCERCREIGGF